MPSEFNHIDEFFRNKEAEALPNLSQQQKHWAEMKTLLSTAPHTETVAKRAGWKGLISYAGWFLAAAALLAYLLVRQNRNAARFDASPAPVTAHADSLPVRSTLVAIAPSTVRPDTVKKLRTNLLAPRHTLQLKPDSVRIPAGNSLIQNLPVTSAPALTLPSFFAAGEVKAQEFLISTDRDTNLVASEGTKLFIPAHAFAGSPSTARLRIREFYEISDIIFQKLATVSGSEPLATGGMLQIQAFEGSDSLQLAPGKTIEIKMPTKRFNPSMQLFTGQTSRESISNHGDSLSAGMDRINWIASGQYPFILEGPLQSVRVLDLLNDPRAVRIRGKKVVGKFILSETSPLTVAEAKALLQQKYGEQYDEIRVRRGWRENKARRYESPLTNGIIGDSVRVQLQEASRLKLISLQDSLLYTARWQKEQVWRDSLNRQYLQIQKEYNFRISNLGWINCDRFLAFAGKRTDLAFDPGEEFAQTYFESFLVFKNMNSILPGKCRGGTMYFGNIPVGQSVVLVCVGIREGRAYAAMKDWEVKESSVEKLQLQPTTPAEFREKLKVLGNVQD